MAFGGGFSYNSPGGFDMSSPYPPSNADPGYPPAEPSMYPGGGSPYPPAGPYPSGQGASQADQGMPPPMAGGPFAGATNPAAAPGYPAAAPGYPGAAPGYPAAAPGYPAASPGFPAAAPAEPPYGASSYPSEGGRPYSQHNSPYPAMPGPSYPATSGQYASQPSGFPGSSIPAAQDQSRSSEVKLSMHASGLPKMDFFSKSDPMCVLFTKAHHGDWTEFGRTEVIKNSHNPSWTKHFTMTYNHGTNQPIKFEVYDADSSSAQLNRQDFMGLIETTIEDIVKSKNFDGRLRGGSKSGNSTISVNAQVLKTIKMQLSAINLKDLDTFSKSDPFFTIRSKDPYGFKTVYTSGVQQNNLNPQWEVLSISDSKLCNCDPSLALSITVMDWDKGGSHDIIGVVNTSLNGLVNAFQRGSQLELSHPKHKKSQRGFLRINKLDIA